MDDKLITKVFENIINKGKLLDVNDEQELVFRVGDVYATIIVFNETKHDEEITNTPLSVDKLIKWQHCPWEWSIHKAIKPGILLTYHIHTSFNDYVIKPKLSKQEEYKEIINNHLHEFEMNYLTKLLST